MSDNITSLIRDVPDFPKPGIIFKDITPLLRSSAAFGDAIEQMTAPFRNEGITAVVAMESRGFIFGAPIARLLNTGFVPIRKPGKLPWTTRRHEYVLEYGSGMLEIHDDALNPEDRVLIVDDVLATGGTAGAAASLVSGLGTTIVAFSMLIELDFLEGRKKLGGLPVHSVVHY